MGIGKMKHLIPFFFFYFGSKYQVCVNLTVKMERNGIWVKLIHPSRHLPCLLCMLLSQAALGFDSILEDLGHKR